MEYEIFTDEEKYFQYSDIQSNDDDDVDPDLNYEGFDPDINDGIDD